MTRIRVHESDQRAFATRVSAIGTLNNHSTTSSGDKQKEPQDMKERGEVTL